MSKGFQKYKDLFEFKYNSCFDAAVALDIEECDKYKEWCEIYDMYNTEVKPKTKRKVEKRSQQQIMEDKYTRLVKKAPKYFFNNYDVNSSYFFAGVIESDSIDMVKYFFSLKLNRPTCSHLNEAIFSQKANIFNWWVDYVGEQSTALLSSESKNDESEPNDDGNKNIKSRHELGELSLLDSKAVVRSQGSEASEDQLTPVPLAREQSSQARLTSYPVDSTNLIQCILREEHATNSTYIEKDVYYDLFKRILKRVGEPSTEVWQEACDRADPVWLDILLEHKHVKYLDSSCIVIYAPKAKNEKGKQIFQKLCMFANSTIRNIYSFGYGIKINTSRASSRFRPFTRFNMHYGIYGCCDAMIAICNDPRRYLIPVTYRDEKPTILNYIHQGTLDNFIELQDKEGIQYVMDFAKKWMESQQEQSSKDSQFDYEFHKRWFPQDIPSINFMTVVKAKQKHGTEFGEWLSQFVGLVR